jgi:hypothetical protein
LLPLSSKYWVGLLLGCAGRFSSKSWLTHKPCNQSTAQPLVDQGCLSEPLCKYHLEFYSLQKPPVYCFLAPGFLRSLDLEKREQGCMLNEVYSVPNGASQTISYCSVSSTHFPLIILYFFSFFYNYHCS